MQKLPVGLSDFKEVIEGNYYFADKSLLIKELIDQGAKVLLIPRPRRFGKTLNLSMLRYFFEKPALPTAPGRPGTTADTSGLFRHLKIWQAGEEYTAKQGKYPVIFLTFKDVKESQWENALAKMKRLMQAEFLRHEYLRVDQRLRVEERAYFEGIVKLSAGQSDYEDSLKQLSDYLARYHNQKVILLIDEYDTPIQAGYVNGYYAEAVGFMRNFLGGGLKDNVNLEKGVLTGIMRVAQESIFSGLNNPGVFTLLQPEFSAAFGLTEEEVGQALKDFNLEDRLENVRNWYNGYVFGDRVVYNPWSLINYLNSADKAFRPYWLHTSDNAIVEKLLTRGGKELKRELESLIAGDGVEKPIEENIVFGEIEQRDDLLWSFLLFGGYLKYLSCRRDDNTDKPYYQLAVPNREVRLAYTDLIARWFTGKFDQEKLTTMLRALRDGDIRLFEHLFQEMVVTIFSYHDFGAESEKVYHAFVTGLLVWLGGDYELKSNRESGYGRYDLMIIPKNKAQIGYVIEFKKVSTYEHETVESAIANALAQIEAKGYETELRQRDVKTIKKLAIVFKGKQVWVKEQSA